MSAFTPVQIKEWQGDLDFVIDELISVGSDACETNSEHAEVVLQMLARLKAMRGMMGVYMAYDTGKTDEQERTAAQ